MDQLTIHFPGKLVFGKNAFQNLSQEIEYTGASSVFILTIEPLLPTLLPLVKDLKSKNITVEFNTSIIQEPSFNDVETILEKAMPADPDVIVGIGGGSVLDAAKVIAALLNNTQSLNDIVGIGNLKARKKKLICLPATSGTGSEVSPNAILIDDKDGQKKGIISPFLVPDIVLADPLLTLSVPCSITAATGLDALTHCLEAYTNKFAHPLIDMYALEGIRLISRHIVRAVKDGNDEEARTGVAMGSLLGGICLGPVNTAAVHALAYPLGTTFHLAHGLSNALLLPFVMEFNMEASPSRYAEVALALGCNREQDDLSTARKGVEKIHEIIRECGMPSRLSELNIPESAIPGLAADAMKITRLLKNNPRLVDLDSAIAIYEAAY
jgi:alcohol dehydrogenase class IV